MKKIFKLFLLIGVILAALTPTTLNAAAKHYFLIGTDNYQNPNLERGFLDDPVTRMTAPLDPADTGLTFEQYYSKYNLSPEDTNVNRKGAFNADGMQSGVNMPAPPALYRDKWNRNVVSPLFYSYLYVGDGGNSVNYETGLYSQNRIRFQETNKLSDLMLVEMNEIVIPARYNENRDDILLVMRSRFDYSSWAPQVNLKVTDELGNQVVGSNGNPKFYINTKNSLQITQQGYDALSWGGKFGYTSAVGSFNGTEFGVDEFNTRYNAGLDTVKSRSSNGVAGGVGGLVKLNGFYRQGLENEYYATYEQRVEDSLEKVCIEYYMWQKDTTGANWGPAALAALPDASLSTNHAKFRIEVTRPVLTLNNAELIETEFVVNISKETINHLVGLGTVNLEEFGVYPTSINGVPSTIPINSNNVKVRISPTGMGTWSDPVDPSALQTALRPYVNQKVDLIYLYAGADADPSIVGLLPDEIGNNLGAYAVPEIRTIDVIAESKVTVNYIDEQGVALAEPVELKDFVGKDYETSALTFNGYRLMAMPTNATGQYTLEPIIVNYIYERIASSVITHFVDTDGNVIAEPVAQGGFMNDPYTTTPIDVSGYRLVTTPANATGLFGDDEINVTYVYERIESTVLIKHVDEDGNEISPSVTLNGFMNDEYTTSPVEVDGYQLFVTPSNASGQYADTETIVTYTYSRVESSVVTNYVDADGNELAPSITQIGLFGDEYTTAPVEIEGYRIVSTPTNATGTFASSDIIVNYVYERIQSSVITKYIDEIGREISPSVTQTGFMNEEYTTVPAQVVGYELVETPTNATGLFGENTITVTYKYARIATQVIARYVDETGKEISPNVFHDGVYGQSYTTLEKDIQGYVLKERPANETGEFGLSNITVTYVYVKAEATVVVKYVDKDGKELSPSVTLIGKIGDPYTTEPKEIKDYKLTTTPSNANGNYTNASITVTYVYEKTSNLPETGQESTLLFGGLGILLVAGGLVILKKKEN